MVNAHGRDGGNAESVAEALRDTLKPPLDLNGAVRVEEARIQFENNSVLDTDLRNFRPGTGDVVFTGGDYEITTTADGTSRQALETARLGKYNAGLPGAIGMLVGKMDDPVGYAEWGYGGEDFTNAMRWHLASDGTYRFDRVRGGVLTEIPRSLWSQSAGATTITDNNGDTTGEVIGLDPLDGTGDSGVEIATPFLGLFGMDFVLYGGGGVAPWVVDLTADGVVQKVYPFVFAPKRETVLTQFNQPIFGRLDNDGTATADSLTVTERQFTVFGKPSQEPRKTPHVFDLAKTAGTPTALYGIRRRNAGGPVPLNLNSMNVSVDSDAHIYFLVNPTITGGGGDANWGQPNYDYAGNTVSTAETTLEVNESLTVDASTGVPIEGGVALSGGGNTVVNAALSGLDNSLFIRDRPVVAMIEPRAGGNDVTSQEGIQTITEGF